MSKDSIVTYSNSYSNHINHSNMVTSVSISRSSQSNQWFTTLEYTSPSLRGEDWDGTPVQITFKDGMTGHVYVDESGFINYQQTLKPEMVVETRLVLKVEEKVEEYIQDNFDRYYIKEHGKYVYQVIQEKAYTFASDIVEQAKEDYQIPSEDEIIEIILENIDFNSLYELVDDILNAPITMEEKLAEVGMSYQDFL